MLWHESVMTLAPPREASLLRKFCGGSGEVLKQRRLPGFILQHVCYREGMDLSTHSHEKAYVSLIVEGCYEESYGGAFTESRAGALRYLPAGAPHANRFATDTRILRTEIQPQLMDHVRESSWTLDQPGEIQGVPSAWLANRLLAEFEGRDALSDLALEGILLEILAEGARTLQSKNAGRGPRWLRAAREYLETRFLEDIRLNEVAQVAGVHPVHLAREFRRHYQSSIGEFVRERRIAHASRLLARSSTPIAEIAITCGFSDQSHFSSVFKRQMGVTPARFREAS